MRRSLFVASMLSLTFVLLVQLDVQAKTAHFVCSKLAKGIQSSQNGLVDWQLAGPNGGIFMPEVYELDIDLSNKTANFTPVGPTGPFKVDIFDVSYVIASSAPNAPSKVTFGIDRRTGAFVKKDESLELSNGTTKVVGTFWETGVCSTKGSN